MCPEPALLVAYLDGTLFHRDARAVDEHVLTCANCTALLDDMRRQREAELHRSRRSSARTIAVAVGAIAIVASGVWFVLPGSKDSRMPDSSGGSDSSTVAGSAKVEDAPRPVIDTDTPAMQEKTPKPAVETETRRVASDRPRVPAEKSPPKAVGRVPQPARPADVETTETTGETGLVLRGRNANRRFAWRVRESVIERSTDEGASWVVEHTAERPIRAGAFVDANVAWFVGENGLVLRRTINGWFGTTPPAEGHLVAVRASSPSRATVTHDDGRIFTTENGGVTWSTP
jgi:hypothetical protein